MARVNVFLKDDVLKVVDKEAAETGRNRSALIQAALTEFLESRRKAREEEALRRKREEACRRMDKLAKKAGSWDGVAIIRKFRDSGWRGAA